MKGLDLIMRSDTASRVCKTSEAAVVGGTHAMVHNLRQLQIISRYFSVFVKRRPLCFFQLTCVSSSVSFRALLSPYLTSLPFEAYGPFHQMIQHGKPMALPIAQLVVQLRFCYVLLRNLKTVISAECVM